ncbi:MAG: hypothetical protein AB7O04_03745 [Hyphomonadaceae bacterium]
MVRRVLNVLAAGAAAALLAACATATPYQPQAANSRYGFAEQSIEQNRVRVSFRGNTLTERETVETYLLYRAAELTVERGFDHFIMVDRDTDARTRLQPMGGSSYYPGFYPRWSYFAPRYGWRPWYDPFWNDPVSYREVSQYEASAEIVMHRGAKPADNAQAFDAREVMRNLEGRVVRPTVPAS